MVKSSFSGCSTMEYHAIFFILFFLRRLSFNTFSLRHWWYCLKLRELLVTYLIVLKFCDHSVRVGVPRLDNLVFSKFRILSKCFLAPVSQNGLIVGHMFNVKESIVQYCSPSSSAHPNSNSLRILKCEKRKPMSLFEEISHTQTLKTKCSINFCRGYFSVIFFC